MANKVREYRDKLHKTQKDVAINTGVTRQTISLIEV